MSEERKISALVDELNEIVNLSPKSPWAFKKSTCHDAEAVPYTYSGEGYCNNPSIVDSENEEVVWCDEYYIFSGPRAVEAIIRLRNDWPAIFRYIKELEGRVNEK